MWQLFDWVAAHGDLADYVKRAVRSLRERFLVAWRAFEAPEASDLQGENEGDDDEAICVETSADQAFWIMPESSRFEVELPPSVQPVIRARTSQVEKYGPDFAAIGRAGFYGYWVFGFTKQGLYVLESRMLDNATYVLGADWEVVSRLTKAEIINSELAVARLVHDRGWPEKLDQVLRHVMPSKAA